VPYVHVIVCVCCAFWRYCFVQSITNGLNNAATSPPAAVCTNDVMEQHPRTIMELPACSAPMMSRWSSMKSQLPAPLLQPIQGHGFELHLPQRFVYLHSIILVLHSVMLSSSCVVILYLFYLRPFRSANSAFALQREGHPLRISPPTPRRSVIGSPSCN